MLKEKTLIVISVNAEKAFSKISFMIKNFF